MKLTKGRIHKILLQQQQTRKKYNKITDINLKNKSIQNHFTTYKNYYSLNLKNKTLKIY